MIIVHQLTLKKERGREGRRERGKRQGCGHPTGLTAEGVHANYLVELGLCSTRTRHFFDAHERKEGTPQPFACFHSL